MTPEQEAIAINALTKLISDTFFDFSRKHGLTNNGFVFITRSSPNTVSFVTNVNNKTLEDALESVLQQVKIGGSGNCAS